MYVCGITPYDATHVGHAATFLVFDVLQRRLRDLGLRTRCVRNVTDVDDDLLARARSAGVHYLDLSARALVAFGADLHALGLLPVHSEPRATSGISDVRSVIGRILERGGGYTAGGNVFFDVTTAPGFGRLSGLGAGGMEALSPQPGERSDLAGRRHPLDVPLWQASDPGEPSWSARWGRGRPGWHVECAALALRELGAPIDLHGGGQDLVYPHHECESAMAEVATGGTFVQHWMHVAMVHVDGSKMSKSAGNLAFIGELRRRCDPMAIRLAILDHHYRQPWDWDEGLLETASARLSMWRSTGTGRSALDEVRAALDEDLAIPDAMAAIDAAARRGHGVSEAMDLIGVR